MSAPPPTDRSTINSDTSIPAASPPPAQVGVTNDTPARSAMPSMQSHRSDRHAALLELLGEISALTPEALVQSDLPERANRLLDEINASNEAPAKTAGTRRFQLFQKNDDVNLLLAKLENAFRRGNIPSPYPIDEDPLGLEAWAAQQSSENVAAIAREFPRLRSALSVYLDASGANHLARTFHAGSNLDFELDLRAIKTWRLLPAHDAVHRGPAANFIVLMKAMLFVFDRADSIPQVEENLVDFIAVRSKDEIASLIRHCKDFAWPDTIAIDPDSRDFYVSLTRDNPVEDILFELIAPIVATHPTKSTLLSLMADVNPSRLQRALQPLNYKPTDAMIENARTPEGRDALRRMKNPG